MSRTYRAYHLSPGKRSKRGGTRASRVRVREPEMAAMVARPGGGFHGKSHKQTRVNERAKLRQEYA